MVKAAVELDAKSIRVLEEALKVLPYSEAELVASGVLSRAVERMLELKRAERLLVEEHGSIDELEDEIKSGGIPVEDHSLYNALLEWRSIRRELEGLRNLLELL